MSKPFRDAVQHLLRQESEDIAMPKGFARHFVNDCLFAQSRVITLPIGEKWQLLNGCVEESRVGEAPDATCLREAPLDQFNRAVGDFPHT
jgi:hypothetical protein